MVASIIAYLMCAVCLAFFAAAIKTCVDTANGKDDADLTVCTGLVFLFGFGAWGFAYLGGAF